MKSLFRISCSCPWKVLTQCLFVLFCSISFFLFFLQICRHFWLKYSILSMACIILTFSFSITLHYSWQCPTFFFFFFVRWKYKIESAHKMICNYGESIRLHGHNRQCNFNGNMKSFKIQFHLHVSRFCRNKNIEMHDGIVH